MFRVHLSQRLVKAVHPRVGRPGPAAQPPQGAPYRPLEAINRGVRPRLNTHQKKELSLSLSLLFYP